MIKNKTIRNIWAFDFIFQTVYLIIFIPFFKEVFKLLLKFLTEGYLTPDTIKEILPSPMKLISFTFVILCVSILNLIEQTSFIFSFNQLRIGNNLTIIQIFNNTYKLIKKKIKIKNLPILIFSILGIPFSNFVSKSIRIPEYISIHFLEKNFIWLYMTIFFIIVFFIVTYTINMYYIFLLEDLSFSASLKESIKLSKKNFKTSSSMVIKILFKRFSLFILKVLILGLILLLFYLKEDRNLRNYEIMIYLTIAGIIRIFLNVAINYVTFNEASKLYFKIRDKKYSSNIDYEKNNKIGLKLGIVVLTVFVIGLGNKYRYSLDEIRHYHTFTNLNPVISAHRGSTKNSAENTLESVEEAINLGADFTEIDVVLTEDNVVVLSHDLNIKRLTGKNINIKDITFEELTKFKINNHPSKKEFSFIDLKSVIEKSKGKIKLNIELKPDKYNYKELAKEVVKLIDKDYENIVVSSLSPKILMEVKDLDNSIQCGFIIAFAYGDFYNAYFADFYAIEESYINPRIINRIHGMNKKVYVWTTNNSDSVQRAFRNGVDGIITDEIEIAKETLNYVLENNEFAMYNFILMKIFRIIE